MRNINMNKKNKIKSMKIKRIISVVLVIFMLISSIAFFNITVFAADKPDITITESGAIQPGKTFRIDVKIENNTDAIISNVAAAGESVTNITLTASDNDKRSIDIGKSEEFSFYYKIDDEKVAGGDIFDISFTITYDKNNIAQDPIKKEKRITVSDMIPQPTSNSNNQNNSDNNSYTSSVPKNMVVITGVDVADSAYPGNILKVNVTVRNNHSGRIPNIVVSTQISNPGVLSLNSFNELKDDFNASEEKTFTFFYTVSKNAEMGDISQLKFTVSAGEGANKVEFSSATRTISVYANPYVEQKPRFEIFSEMYPQKVGLGANMKISFRFASMGGVANYIKVTVTTPDGIKPVSPATIPVGTLYVGENYLCNFEFEVTGKADLGYNEFKITIETTDNSIPALTYPIGVYVERSAFENNKYIPDVKIVSSELPENIKKGDRFQIKAVLENSGADAENILVTLVSPTGIANISPNIIQINSLKQYAQSEIFFDAVVTDSASDHYNLFRILIDYTIMTDDNKTEKIEKVQYVGLNVAGIDRGLQNFTIDAKIPGNVKPGEDFKAVITITNNGESEKNLYLKIENPTGIINKTINNFSVGELKSGESAAKEVVFNATEEIAGRYCYFGISVYAKQTGGIDTVLAEQYAGTVVSNIAQAKITIDSINIPQNINIGDTFDVDVIIANTDMADAENIILTVTAPNGVLNKTASTVKIDSVKSARKETVTFAFIVTQNASYGYNPFSIDVSYPSKSNAGGEKINQYFGITVNSSDLRIESIRIPGSVGINSDFNVDVAIKNTGADTTDVVLSLVPQAGLINKSSNIIKIDNIKSGETVIRSFAFMASESSPNGYVAIDVTLSHGEDQIRQYSGTIVRNPPKKEDEKKPDEKSEIPVVIISKFSYKNVGESNPPANTGMDAGMDFNADFDFGDDLTPEQIMPRDGEDQFLNTSVVAVPIFEYSDSVAVPGRGRPDYQDGGSFGSSSGGGNLVSPAIDTNAVYGGKTFMFTVEFLNTHKYIAVKDLKITISQEKGIFNPKSGSNTFFVEMLYPGETTEISIELLVKSDADPDSYGLTISMSYKNDEGESTSSSEIINIPVQQEMRFSVGDMPPINDIEMGDDVYINVQFGNLGKSWIYNVVVRVQGDGFMNMEGTYYAGNIEKGKFLAKEFTLTPFNPGFQNGSFIFTYEDADGNVFQEDQPFSFMVAGGDDMMMEGMFPGMDGGEGIVIGPDGMPVMSPEENTEESGKSWISWLFTDMNLMKWAILIGGVLFVILLIVVIIVVIVKVRKKKSGYDDDDE